MSDAFGSSSNPYIEDTLVEEVVEVGWGGTIGILTVVLAGNTNISLDPQPDITAGSGPYNAGDSIPRTDWNDADANTDGDDADTSGGTTDDDEGTVDIASVDFTDIDHVDQVHDGGFDWSKQNFYPAPAPGAFSSINALNPGGVPDRGTIAADDAGDAFYNHILDTYSKYKAGYDATWAPYIGNPNYLFSEQTSSLPYFNGLTTGVSLLNFEGDHRRPAGTPITSYPYIDYDIWNEVGFGGVIHGPPSGTSDLAVQAWNKYGPAEVTSWPILRVKIPYDPLYAFRSVYLIDFKQLAKDHADDPTVRISQFVNSQDDHISSWDNSFELRIYGAGAPLVAGDARTITTTATPSYSATRTLAWSADGSGLLSFNKDGWVS